MGKRTRKRGDGGQQPPPWMQLTIAALLAIGALAGCVEKLL